MIEMDYEIPTLSKSVFTLWNDQKGLHSEDEFQAISI